MKARAFRALGAAVVLAALLVLLIVQILPKQKVQSDGLQDNSHILYSDSVPEEAMSGYEKNGTELIITNNDPQLYFYTAEYDGLSTITLTFTEPLENKLSIQVFYDNGGGFSEQNSRWGECPAGTECVVIDIPEDQYQMIRIDIEGGRIPLDKIVAENINLKPIGFPWVISTVLTIVFLSFAFFMMDHRGNIIQFRIGFGVFAFSVSLLFTILIKKRLGIAEAFNVSDINRFLVTVSDICFSMLTIFWVASFFRSFRRRFGLQEQWFSGTEKMVLGFSAMVYLFWILSFPYSNYAPDETMRYDIPKYIFQTGALPFGWEESIRNSYWGVSYGFDISLPYLSSSYLMELMSFFSLSDNMLLIAARLSSLLSSIGTVALALLIGKRFFTDSPMRWVYVALISMLPQIVFLSSYVNLDSFSLLTAMLITYCWTICLDEKWSVRSCSWLAIAIALCFMSYKFAYGYILLSVFLYIAWYVMNRKEISFNTFIRRGLLIIGIVFILCGWKFIRNAVLYNGDFLSLNASKPYAELYAQEQVKPSNVETFASKGIGLTEMLRTTPWIKVTSQSIVGVFGYLNVFMQEWFYQSYNVILLGGLIASTTLLLPGRKQSRKEIMVLFAMGFASLAAFAVSVYFSWCGDYQAQGRYIITILPFIFLLVGLGYDRLCEIMFSRVSTAKIEISAVFSACISGFVIITMVVGYIRCLQYFGILQV